MPKKNRNNRSTDKYEFGKKQFSDTPGISGQTQILCEDVVASYQKIARLSAHIDRIDARIAQGADFPPESYARIQSDLDRAKSESRRLRDELGSRMTGIQINYGRYRFYKDREGVTHLADPAFAVAVPLKGGKE